MQNLRILIVAGIALTSGIALAAPTSQSVAPALVNRAQLIASRMGTTGECYDRAASAVRPAANERVQLIASRMGTTGESYERAASAVRSGAYEGAQAVANGRWSRHLAAMERGGSHDAGWAAANLE